jgi:hypothetical protein
MSEFWTSILVKKSRKKHRCEYCGAVIEIGASYSRESGKFEGEMQDYALCLRCRKLLDSNNPTWAMDDGELGNFHDAFVDSYFVHCPKCGQNDISDFHYSEDQMTIKIECECGEDYTVDLSAENLLKREP